MNTEYADAVNKLNDEIDAAIAKAERVLSKKEIIEELSRIAADLEDE